MGRLWPIVLTAVVAAGLPAGAAYAGGAGPTTVVGQVEHVAADRYVDGHLVTSDSYRLRVGVRTYALVAAGRDRLATGATVRVIGTTSGSVLTAASTSVVRPAADEATTGTPSVHVILADWTSPDSTTTAQVVQHFADVGAWYQEDSYGALTGFVVTTTNWVHIADPGSCDADAINTSAVAAAGINPADYQHVVVYFPNTSACDFAGLGDVGGSRMWLNGLLDVGVTAHEMGHNLGLSHSHSLICTDPATQAPVTISSTCGTADEYGDPADTMGGGGAVHFSASQKASLGWLGVHLDDAAPCGSVQLAPYETLPSSGFVAARVDAGADPQTGLDRAYWLEYRQPSGRDSALPAGLQGVLLHETDPFQHGSNDNGPDLLDGTPGSAGGFTDAAVPVGNAVPTPEGYTFSVASADASGATVTLTTTTPSVPLAAQAAASGSSPRVSWQPPACTGDSAVTSYTVTARNPGGAVVAQASSTTTSATLSSVPLTADHTFLVTATNANGRTGQPSVVPITAPRITGLTYFPTWAHVSFTPSVSDGGNVIDGYVLTATPVGGGTPVYNYWDSSTDTGPFGLDAIADQPGGRWSVTITPQLHDGSYGPPSAPVTFTMGDDTAPSVRLTSPGAWTLGSTAKGAWTATDTGGSGFASYDVRYRTAAWNGTLSRYTYPSTYQHTTRTSLSLSASRGSTYCFSVRARDHNGNLSSWSRESCTGVPLDDRSLTAGSGWSRGTGSSYYAGTDTKAARSGVSLTLHHVHAGRLSLLATVCPTCGKVAVYSGSTLLTTLNLAASTTRNRVLLTVPLHSALAGVTVTLRTASARTVRIDGLAVAAR